METEFNVDQVFQIAGRIQQNGAEFYLKMAKRFCDSERRGLCSELANWRVERAKALAEERKRFFGKSGFMTIFLISKGSFSSSFFAFLRSLTTNLASI